MCFKEGENSFRILFLWGISAPFSVGVGLENIEDGKKRKVQLIYSDYYYYYCTFSGTTRCYISLALDWKHTERMLSGDIFLLFSAVFLTFSLRWPAYLFFLFLLIFSPFRVPFFLFSQTLRISGKDWTSPSVYSISCFVLLL